MARSKGDRTQHKRANSDPPTAVPPPAGTPPDEPPKGGRPPTFQEVYAKYADFVFRMLRRLGVHPDDAADQTQNLFCAVYRNWHKFDPTKPVEPWLYSFCEKYAHRYRRSAYIRRVLTVDICSFWEKSSTELSPEQNMTWKQEQDAVDELLDKLDPEKRAAFVMYEIDEMSCEEIAKQLGIPVGTVHSRLSAARKELIKAYQRREAKRKREEDQ